MSVDTNFPVQSGTITFYEFFEALEPKEKELSTCGQILGRLFLGALVRGIFSILGTLYNFSAAFIKAIASVFSNRRVELFNQVKSHVLSAAFDAFCILRIPHVFLGLSYLFAPNELRYFINGVKATIQNISYGRNRAVEA